MIKFFTAVLVATLVALNGVIAWPDRRKISRRERPLKRLWIIRQL